MGVKPHAAYTRTYTNAMRKPEKQTLNGGRTTYKVRFRWQGKETSRRFDTYRDAQTFCSVMADESVAEAIRWHDDVLRARHEANAPTLDELVPAYIASLTKATEGTKKDYQRKHDLYWSPRLGKRRVDQITKLDVANALTDLSLNGAMRNGKHGKGLSDKTCANAHGFLAGAMSFAAEQGHISTSPCRGVKLPERTGHDQGEMRFLTEQEFAAVFEHVPDHWRPLTLFLVLTGVRLGEAFGLLSRDVDLNKSIVNIRRAVKWQGGDNMERIVGPPKTKRSRRSVTMPPILTPVLLPLKEANPTGELFRDTRGNPLGDRWYYKHVWRPAVLASGLEEPLPRIHDLRHTSASWQIQNGVDLVTIQRRMGHESITTTIDRYGHLSPDQDARAAAVLGQVLLSARQSPAIAALISPANTPLELER